MNSTQLYLSIGVPSFLVILAWLSNRADIQRMADRIDKIAEKVDQGYEAARVEMARSMESLRIEMISFRREINADFVAFRKEMNADMTAVRREIDSDIVPLHERIGED